MPPFSFQLDHHQQFAQQPPHHEQQLNKDQVTRAKAKCKQGVNSDKLKPLINLIQIKLEAK